MTAPWLVRRTMLTCEWMNPRGQNPRGFDFQLELSVKKAVDPLSGMGVNLRDLDFFLADLKKTLFTKGNSTEMLAVLTQRTAAQAGDWACEGAGWSLERAGERWEWRTDFPASTWLCRLERKTAGRWRDVVERDFVIRWTWRASSMNSAPFEARVGQWLPELSREFTPAGLFALDPSLLRIEWAPLAGGETHSLERE